MRYSDCLWYFYGIVIHKYNISSFDCRVRAHCAHSNSNIGSAEHRSVVYTVSDKRKLLVVIFTAKYFLNLIYLVSRKQFAVYRINSKLHSCLLGRRFCIARQHNGFSYTNALQLIYCILRVRFNTV